MRITSLSFFAFILLLWVIYYFLSEKHRWVVLLVSSIIFYSSFSAVSFIYVLATSALIYCAAIAIQRITENNKTFLKVHKAALSKEEKKEWKEKAKKQKRWVLRITIVLVFSALFVFKYSHFAIDIANKFLSAIGIHPINNSFSLLIPLGISYYTLQATAYLAEVYWEKIPAESHYGKVLLFISFFPQITQGPISEYGYLSGELFKEHHISYEKVSKGFQRMLWGFFKKMVIADTFSPYVSTIFSGYEKYTGLTCAVGALLYVFQLYADFSGYMDIMCGFCEMLDIRLTENFNRPFFSKSVAEFWRRWHISLGRWVRTYIYYPIAMSSWNQRLSKRIISDSRVSGIIASTAPLVVVWSFIGLWHDASWEYIAWGLGNAFFIISSIWLEPLYRRMKTALRIREQSVAYKVFQIARTFIIFTVLESMAAVTAKGGDGLRFVLKTMVNHQIPRKLGELFPSTEGLVGQFIVMLMLAFVGLVLMLVFSLIQRKKPVREYFNQVPCVVRIAILVVMALVIVSAGVQASWDAGAFMYANF